MHPSFILLMLPSKSIYLLNAPLLLLLQRFGKSVLSFVVGEMKLSITSVNGRIDKNSDAILEAQISLSDISEVELLIKKMQADKRIYEVHRITSLT